MPPAGDALYCMRRLLQSVVPTGQAPTHSSRTAGRGEETHKGLREGASVGHEGGGTPTSAARSVATGGTLIPFRDQLITSVRLCNVVKCGSRVDAR